MTNTLRFIVRMACLVGFCAAPAAWACGTLSPQRVVFWGNYDNDHADYPEVWMPDPHGLIGGACSVQLGGGGANSDGHGVFQGETYLYPGKVYLLSYSAEDMVNLSVILSVPAGFDLFIDGKQQSSVWTTGMGSAAWSRPLPQMSSGSWKVELREKNCGDAAGVSSDFDVANLMWTVGLGRLKNGQLAGKITVREYSFTSALYARTALNYMATTPEVEPISDTGGLRQVRAPETLVDVTDVAGGFLMKFYSAADISGLSNGLYTVGSAALPFVTYEITNGGVSNRLKIVRTIGDYSEDMTADYDPGTAAWNKNVAAVRHEDHGYGVDDNGDRLDTVTVKDGSDVVASKTVNTYHTFQWGGELIKSVEDPDGHAYTTTSAYYSSGDADAGASPGKLKQRTYPDGSWVFYTYYNAQSEGSDYAHSRSGQIRRIYRPWKDSPATPSADDTNCLVTEYDYGADGSGVKNLPISVITTKGGVVMEKDLITNTMNTSANGAVLWTRTIASYAGSSSVVTRIVKMYRAEQASDAALFYSNLMYSEQRPDNTMDAYAHLKGTYNAGTHSFSVDSGDDVQEVVLHGVTPTLGQSLTGATGYTSWGGATIDNIYLIPNQSTVVVMTRQRGRVVREETQVYTGSAFAVVAWTNYEYTLDGQLTARTSNNGAIYGATWANGFKTDETDESGITYHYTPDALNRVQYAAKKAGSGYTGRTLPSSDIVTTYTYDAEGRTLSAVTSGGAYYVTSSATYDLGGRISSQTVPGGYTTSYSYANGGRTITKTLPGGATTVTENYLDGQLKSITGTAQIPSYFDYSFDGSGHRITTTHAGTSASGKWSAVTTDWLGRRALERHPDQNGHDVDTAYAYNAQGQLRKTAVSATGATLAPTLYAYTSMGTPWRNALDVDGDDTIGLSGPDRITEVTTGFVSAGGNWYWVTNSAIYPDGVSTPKTVQTKEVRLTFPATGTLRSEVTVTDINGNASVQTTAIDRTARLTTVSTTVPGSNVAARQISYNGMLVESRSEHDVTTKWDYDGLGRVSKAIDARKTAVITQYYSQTNLVWRTAFDSNGPLIATYYYDAAGRMSAVEDAESHVTRMQYNSRGQLEYRWGDGAHPLRYVYDSLGRVSEQYTYRGGSGWSGSSWPSDVGSGDLAPSKTTLRYYGDLSLLHEKEDAAGRVRQFTYDALGRMTHRYLPRDAATTLETEYAFDPATGELTGVDYKDATPDVSYTYRRTGALESVTDTLGTRTFSYNADLQLGYEALPSYYGTGRRLTYGYASGAVPVVGRLSGFSVGTSTAPATYQIAGYTYKADGRVEQISGNGAGLTNYAFTYAYTAHADNLIAGITSSQTSVAQSRTYASRWDVTESTMTTYPVSGSPVAVARYDYTYTDRGLRATGKQSGGAYADYVEPTYYRYGYNGRGELTAARGYVGTDVTVTTKPMSGRQYQFGYDPIGNRTSANRTDVGALLESFMTNSLNQIVQRDHHTVAVQGTARSDATVLVAGRVNGQPINSLAGRAGTYFGGEANLDNVDQPAYESVGIVAAVVGGGSGGADLIAQTSSPAAFLPASPEHLAYDYEGNVTADGQWQYTWDGENRLIAIETTSEALGTGVPGVKLTMRYDYLGRRVEKKVYGRSGTSWSGTPQKTIRYLYNGWNVIAEQNESNVIQRHLFWGLDLSGSGSAMGGIGGLLFMQDNVAGQWKAFVPGYDGSGNVAVMLNAATGEQAAIYEYSPFGELLRAEGTYAEINPFRSATKYTDETGLVYYGHRYYSASLGRFINRDPIEEAGGINLYAFAGNNPVNAWDVLGLFEYCWVQSPLTGEWFNICDDDPKDRGQDPVPFWTSGRSPGDGSVNGGGGSAVSGTQSSSTNSNIDPNKAEHCAELRKALRDAKLSRAAYGDVAPPGAFQAVGDFFADNQSGFSATLFENANTGERVLAYAGTDGWTDVGTDAMNAIGIGTRQRDLAIATADQVIKTYGTANFSFTGHSLGGFLVGSASMATGIPGRTFNAAGPVASDSYRSSSAALITNYYVSGEAVTVSQGAVGFNRALGSQVQVAPVDGMLKYVPGLLGNALRSGERHKIDSMIDALQQKILNECY